MAYLSNTFKEVIDGKDGDDQNRQVMGVRGRNQNEKKQQNSQRSQTAAAARCDVSRLHSIQQYSTVFSIQDRVLYLVEWSVSTAGVCRKKPDGPDRRCHAPG